MKPFPALPLLAAFIFAAVPGCSVAERDAATGKTDAVADAGDRDQRARAGGEAPGKEARADGAKLAPLKLTVVSADSEETEGEDGKAANAVDGDANTFWHTRWSDANPPCPHEIVIALDRVSLIDRLTYLPRQDEGENGTIKEYAVYVSNDGKDFGAPVCQGMFENDKKRKTAAFGAVSCRFIKLKALSEVNGEAWTSAAEIGVLRKGDMAPPTP